MDKFSFRLSHLVMLSVAMFIVGLLGTTPVQAA